jgi:hypothetical protein
MALDKTPAALATNGNNISSTIAVRKPRGPNVPRVLTFADHLAATIKSFESMTPADRERLIGVLRATYPAATF